MFASKPLSSTARLAVASLAILLTAGAACAQTTSSASAPRQRRARRETNASREARIQREIEDTYTHRYEIVGGGGFLRFQAGPALQRDNQVTWDVSTNYFLNPKLFVLGSARGSFGYAKLTNNPYVLPNAQINEYFFQGGAGYRFYRREKFAVSAQAIGGIADGIFSGGAKGHYGYQVGIWQDGLRPAVSASVNLDYNFYPNLGFRFSPVYQATLFTTGPGAPTGSGFQSHAGFNAGIIYRFGRQ